MKGGRGGSEKNIKKRGGGGNALELWRGCGRGE